MKNEKDKILVNYTLKDKYTFDSQLISEISKSVDIVHFLTMIVEKSHDGICITDGEAKKLYVNQAYEKITGLKKEELIGKSMKDLQNSGIISESIALKVIKAKQTMTFE